MGKIINWLMPKDKKFFEMIEEQSGNVLEAAKELKSLIDGYSSFERKERKAKANSIKNLEEKIDGLSHEIARKLDNSAAPGVARMQKIALILEEIADLIRDTALSFVILSIERIDDYMLKLADMLHSSAQELNKIILEMKSRKSMKESCEKLQILKNGSEEMYNEAVSELFHFYKNSIDIMKHREVYELLKNAVKKCRSAAEIADSMAAVHS